MLSLLLACSIPANPFGAATAPVATAETPPSSPGPSGTPSGAPASGPSVAATTRVYASLVSHNEEAPHPKCTPVVTDAGVYAQNRTVVAEMAREVVSHKAAWNLQSDWQFAEAVRQWDSASLKADTQGKNIIDFVANLDRSRVAVDAHAHETAYNYADVAAMLARLGAPDTGVVGGFIYHPSEHEVWTRLRGELTGSQDAAARWRPQILWGAATYMHQGPDLKLSGIWRPAHPDRFSEDDPSQSLVYVGSYMDGFVGVYDLLDRLKRGELEPGRMYTATVFVHQCDLTSSKVAATMAEVDKLAPEVEAGHLVWTPIGGMVQTWRELYNSAPLSYAPPADAMPPSRKPGAGAPGGARRSPAGGGGPKAPAQPELRAPRQGGGVPPKLAPGGAGAKKPGIKDEGARRPGG